MESSAKNNITKSSRSQSRLVIAERPTTTATSQKSARLDISLVDLCRNVLVAHLERYPPAMFAACDEEEWEAIIQLRHTKTQPKKKTGGLDGTGRIAPALSDKFLQAVEEQNEHLRESTRVDELVWRDCTEYKFRSGGLARPKGLLWPWPVRVEETKRAVELLQQQVLTLKSSIDDSGGSTEREMLQTIDALFVLPMNVTLLQETGAGKVVRKAVKAFTKQNRQGTVKKRLETLLQSYMALASDAGVQVADNRNNSKRSSTTASNNNKKKDCLEDLTVSESCSTWRQLFAVLQEREETRRSSQGKRMREIRRNLASGRPKVVKVRPTTAKQQRILHRPQQRAAATTHSSSSSSSPPSKLDQVRREARISRSQMTVPTKSKGGSFGDAVAFVSGPKKKASSSNKRKHTMQVMGGNRRLKMPTAPSRHFTPKFRNTKR